MNASGKHQGVVKWFNASKGYGFIAPDEPSLTDGKDIFVHYSAIQTSGFKKLEENQRVEFTIQDVARGKQAEDVLILAVE